MLMGEAFNQLVAAVILSSSPHDFLLKDSKKLTSKQRAELSAIIVDF
jgi:ribonuclease HII